MNSDESMKKVAAAAITAILATSVVKRPEENNPHPHQEYILTKEELRTGVYIYGKPQWNYLNNYPLKARLASLTEDAQPVVLLPVYLTEENI